MFSDSPWNPNRRICTESNGIYSNENLLLDLANSFDNKPAISVSHNFDEPIETAISFPHAFKEHISVFEFLKIPARVFAVSSGSGTKNNVKLFSILGEHVGGLNIDHVLPFRWRIVRDLTGIRRDKCSRGI